MFYLNMGYVIFYYVALIIYLVDYG